MAQILVVPKVTDIRAFLESGPNGRPTSAKDLTDLKNTCTPDEWEKMKYDAYEAMLPTLSIKKPEIDTAEILL